MGQGKRELIKDLIELKAKRGQCADGDKSCQGKRELIKDLIELKAKRGQCADGDKSCQGKREFMKVLGDLIDAAAEAKLEKRGDCVAGKYARCNLGDTCCEGKCKEICAIQSCKTVCMLEE